MKKYFLLIYVLITITAIGQIPPRGIYTYKLTFDEKKVSDSIDTILLHKIKNTYRDLFEITVYYDVDKGSAAIYNFGEKGQNKMKLFYNKKLDDYNVIFDTKPDKYDTLLSLYDTVFSKYYYNFKEFGANPFTLNQTKYDNKIIADSAKFINGIKSDLVYVPGIPMKFYKIDSKNIKSFTYFNLLFNLSEMDGLINQFDVINEQFNLQFRAMASNIVEIKPNHPIFDFEYRDYKKNPNSLMFSMFDHIAFLQGDKFYRQKHFEFILHEFKSNLHLLKYYKPEKSIENDLPNGLITEESQEIIAIEEEPDDHKFTNYTGGNVNNELYRKLIQDKYIKDDHSSEIINRFYSLSSYYLVENIIDSGVEDYEKLISVIKEYKIGSKFFLDELIKLKSKKDEKSIKILVSIALLKSYLKNIEEKKFIVESFKNVGCKFNTTFNVEKLNSYEYIISNLKISYSVSEFKKEMTIPKFKTMFTTLINAILGNSFHIKELPSKSNDLIYRISNAEESIDYTIDLDNHIIRKFDDSDNEIPSNNPMINYDQEHLLKFTSQLFADFKISNSSIILDFTRLFGLGYSSLEPLIKGEYIYIISKNQNNSDYIYLDKDLDEKIKHHGFTIQNFNAAVNIDVCSTQSKIKLYNFLKKHKEFLPEFDLEQWLRNIKTKEINTINDLTEGMNILVYKLKSTSYSEDSKVKNVTEFVKNILLNFNRADLVFEVDKIIMDKNIFYKININNQNSLIANEDINETEIFKVLKPHLSLGNKNAYSILYNNKLSYIVFFTDEQKSEFEEIIKFRAAKLMKL